MKIYSVFDDEALTKLFSNDTINHYDSHIHWYHELFEGEHILQRHSTPEFQEKLVSADYRMKHICCFLYLEDAIKIKNSFNVKNIISFDIDENLLSNNIFLREFWSSEKTLLDYGMYHYMMPIEYLRENLSKIQIVDQKALEETIEKEKRNLDEFYCYPAQQRDYLTACVSHTGRHQLNGICYYMEQWQQNQGKGTKYLSVYGALLYPSINWIQKNISSQELNHPNAGYIILDKALKHIDDIFYPDNYDYVPNKVLLEPKETTLYRILTSLINVCGEDASYEEIFNNINYEEFDKIIKDAAQATFNNLYEVKDGVLKIKNKSSLKTSTPTEHGTTNHNLLHTHKKPKVLSIKN